MSAEEGFTQHPFDLEYGVQTSGLIPGRFLKTGHAHDRHSTAYFGVAPSVFQALLKRWQRTRPAAPIESFSFLDLGAGMGRAILLASEYRLRKVIGVELNPILAAMARRNLSKWRAGGHLRTPARVVCGDAVSARLSRGPCLVFLFNPFGESVMRRLVKRLAARFAKRPGQLDVLYVNNEHDRVISLQSGFTRLFVGQVRRSRRDAVADHCIMANQPDGEYEASIYEDCSIWRWTGQA
ncbi:MAG TPA: class I SAM-dependent methyltransferase [Terracidiphilus sp.]|jgi:SAM-dependent methyltransferase